MKAIAVCLFFCSVALGQQTRSEKAVWQAEESYWRFCTKIRRRLILLSGMSVSWAGLASKQIPEVKTILQSAHRD